MRSAHLVQPAHGGALSGIPKDFELVVPGARKLGRIRDLLEDGPSTAYDVMTRLWLRGGQDLDLGATRLAMTETVAYLRHLAAAGLVTWDDNGTGVRRWRAVDRDAAEKSTTDKGLT